ncbi:MAG: hypothetical protein V8T87_01355 [Victivallales bacterium]
MRTSSMSKVMERDSRNEMSCRMTGGNVDDDSVIFVRHDGFQEQSLCRNCAVRDQRADFTADAAPVPKAETRDFRFH